MVARTAVAPRFLRAAQLLPAASRLKPTLLLSLQTFDAAVRLGRVKEAALQLAECGAGMALGLAPSFADREAVGTLCRPMAASNPTGGYWLLHRREDGNNAALRVFKCWPIVGLAADS